MCLRDNATHNQGTVKTEAQIKCSRNSEARLTSRGATTGSRKEMALEVGLVGGAEFQPSVYGAFPWTGT